jgi:NAD(P)-dependent dehydrogenase (short-subunit alcohol dehydrogenase family)
MSFQGQTLAGQPEDIAAAAVFLVSPGSAWITAETLIIASGYR